MELIIEIRNISKVYPARIGFRDLRGEAGIFRLLRKQKAEQTKVLNNINLEVYKGETVGIIGKNGSGKSTLLKIIAGVTAPTSGSVKVYGRIASLLELGAGFHPLLTGRENIYLNASLLGMRKKQVDEVIEQIIDFSGVGEFIDQPVDTYSSGMYVRLGFAIASHVNPDVFLVDEVLAVGDEEFQRKCRWKIGELHEQGKTIVFVSHDLGTVNAICDRVFLLENGTLIDRGSVTSTINYYLRKIGRESGIHTLIDEENQIEAIFCHGRLSLFHDKVEITSPLGIEQSFIYLQQIHSSTHGDWWIEERESNHLKGAGTLFRLPIKCNWETKIEGKEILIDSSYELTKEVEIQATEFRIFLPENYDSFFYAGREEKFTPILPGNTTWTTLVPPKPRENFVFVFSSNNKTYPPLKIDFSHSKLATHITIGNTDYITRSRFIAVHTQIPRISQYSLPGKFEGGKLKISIISEKEFNSWREKWESTRKIMLGEFYAKLGEGYLEFFSEKDNNTLTNAIHFHYQFRYRGMWLLSQTFFWENSIFENNKWIIKGKSPRFPVGLVWEMWRTNESTLEMDLYLEAYEDVEIEEYNVSLALKTEYSEWETSYERSEFPPISEEQKEYLHLNKTYKPSNWIKAYGENLPVFTLFTDMDNKFRMTAINPEFSLSARILQAIASPEQRGYFNFNSGRHLIFSGGVKISREYQRNLR